MTQATAQQCAYPGCHQPVTTRSSARGAKPKYCDDASHNPLNAHRERRKREADDAGQRAEETGGQPVTIGLTRAAELVRKLEQLTARHADTLTRAITELRSAADPESAEAEVYAARASADQRIAAAEARLAEEINSRRAAEAERDQARAERDEYRAATDARLAALEETRTALRIRAERAEADLDTARAEHQRLTDQLDKATADTEQHPRAAGTPSPHTRPDSSIRAG
jgi:colicin import membrane protein